jgi:hypothetical protein
MTRTNADRSATLAAMRAAGAPLTREEFLIWNYLGDVPETIDAEAEAEFPEQFQLATLLDTPPASESIQ